MSRRPSFATGQVLVPAIALAVVLWIGAAWTVFTPGPLDRFGQLKGTDFAQFYVAARLAASGQLSRLYDWQTFSRALVEVVPGSVGSEYLSVYPPQLAIAMTPLGSLPYLTALVGWSVVSAGLYTLAVVLIARSEGALRRRWGVVAIVALAFPPLQQLMLHGQVTALGLLSVTLAWLAWQRGQRFSCGIALGSLVFKPPLCSTVLSAALLAPSVPLVGGVAVAAAVQLGLIVVVGGTAPLVGYWQALGRIASAPELFEPKLWQMHSLRGALGLLVGPGRVSLALYAVGALVVLWYSRRVFFRTGVPEIRFSIVVVAGLLLDPHLYVYDLVILIVPVLLIAGWLDDTADRAQSGHIARALSCLYWVALLGPAAVLTQLPITTPAMAYLLWALASQQVSDAAVPAPATGHR